MKKNSLKKASQKTNKAEYQDPVGKGKNPGTPKNSGYAEKQPMSKTNPK